MNKFYRTGLFVLTTILPILFGWWIFLPLILFNIYFIKLPYEIVLAGVLLDSLYYFGDGFLNENRLTLMAFFAILGALFLSDRLRWQRRI